MGIKPVESYKTDARADQLIDQLCLLRPLTTETWSTQVGESDVVVCDAFTVSGDELTEVGTVPIFWGAVRRELTNAKRDADTDYLALRIVSPAGGPKGADRMYTVVSPTPEELDAADKLLTAWEQSHPPGTRPKNPNPDTGDEEPF